MRFIPLCIMLWISLACRAGSADAAAVSLSASETDERLGNAARLLDNQETKADYWEYGWGAFDGGTMLWSAAQANRETDRKARNTDIVQAAESLAGLADVIFRPLPAFNASSACLDSADTEIEKQECLTAKERLLERSAERARDPYTFLPHLGNAGFNLVAGLITWKVGGRGRALQTAIPGEIIGEIQLWTTPSGPMADWDKYKIKFSPLLAETGHTQNPAYGLMFTLPF